MTDHYGVVQKSKWVNSVHNINSLTKEVFEPYEQDSSSFFRSHASELTSLAIHLQQVWHPDFAGSNRKPGLNRKYILQLIPPFNYAMESYIFYGSNCEAGDLALFLSDIQRALIIKERQSHIIERKNNGIKLCDFARDMYTQGKREDRIYFCLMNSSELYELSGEIGKATQFAIAADKQANKMSNKFKDDKTNSATAENIYWLYKRLETNLKIQAYKPDNSATVLKSMFNEADIYNQFFNQNYVLFLNRDSLEQKLTPPNSLTSAFFKEMEKEPIKSTPRNVNEMRKDLLLVFKHWGSKRTTLRFGDLALQSYNRLNLAYARHSEDKDVVNLLANKIESASIRSKDISDKLLIVNERA
jgi:hypothetical protein